MRKILQDKASDASALRAGTQEVTKEMFGGDLLATLLKDMREALDQEEDGLALAAPQIGIPYRIFIVRLDRLTPSQENEKPKAEYATFINPKIIKTSRKQDIMDEGCLSVRGLYGKTSRYERATVRAFDEQGRVFTRGGGGVLAQAFQHEIDHLDGILFIDHALETYADERFKEST